MKSMYLICNFRMKLSEERKEGLKVLICACKELSHTYPETVEQLNRRYALSDEEAEENMKLYW